MGRYEFKISLINILNYKPTSSLYQDPVLEKKKKDLKKRSHMGVQFMWYHQMQYYFHDKMEAGSKCEEGQAK